MNKWKSRVLWSERLPDGNEWFEHGADPEIAVVLACLNHDFYADEIMPAGQLVRTIPTSK